jgi:hypothetical protein
MRKSPAEGTRKRRSFLRSTGALVAATAIGGCSSSQLTGGDERHQPVRTFAEGFRNDDVDTVRSSLHSESPVRRSLDEEQVSATSVEIVTIETRSSEGDRATVQAQLEFSGASGAPDGQAWYTFEVRRDGEGWGIWQLQRGRSTPTAERTPTRTEADGDAGTETERESTPETTPPDDAVFYDGFEDDLSQWNVVASAWRRTSTTSVSGANSAGIDTRSRTETIATADLGSGRRISEFSYYWVESSRSWGGGIRLLNDAGEVEIGTTSDNPEWVVDGAEGITQVHPGTEYQRWIQVTLRFDWSDGTAEVEFRDTESGETYTGTHSLKRGENVRTIQLRGFTSERDWQTNECHMLWDDILARE